MVTLTVITVVTASCEMAPAASLLPSASSLPASPTKDPQSPFGTTRDQFFLGVKACLAAQGIEVTVDPAKYLIAYNGTDPQYQDAERKCSESVDAARVSVHFQPSEAQLKALYAFMVDKATCLRDAGYPVPAAPPERVFIDSGGEWDPLAPLAEAQIHPSGSNSQRCDRVPSRPAFLDW